MTYDGEVRDEKKSRPVERSLESIPADPSMVMTEQVDQAVGFDSKAPVDHATPMAADVSFRERYEEATRAGRWMAACWCVEGNVVVLNGITTSNFPRGDFDVAVRQLMNGLEELRKNESNPPEPAPLPKADLGNDIGEQVV